MLLLLLLIGLCFINCVDVDYHVNDTEFAKSICPLYPTFIYDLVPVLPHGKERTDFGFNDVQYIYLSTVPEGSCFTGPLAAMDWLTASFMNTSLPPALGYFRTKGQVIVDEHHKSHLSKDIVDSIASISAQSLKLHVYNSIVCVRRVPGQYAPLVRVAGTNSMILVESK